MTQLRAITLQIGQRVKVTESALNTVNESFRGKAGTIVDIAPLTAEFPIGIVFDGLPNTRQFEERELEVIE